MSKFGERLKRLREQRDFSRRKLEELADIPHGIISRLESDDRAFPSVPVAIKLAKVFGVTLDYLCGMYDETERMAAAGALVGA